MLPRSVLCTAVVVALMAPARAEGQEEAPEIAAEARIYLERAARSFAEGDYERAVEQLRTGYRLEPHRDFLYAEGQAEREAGNCRAAIDAYRRFLDSDPPPDEARRAELNIERCEQQLERQPAREGSDEVEGRRDETGDEAQTRPPPTDGGPRPLEGTGADGAPGAAKRSNADREPPPLRWHGDWLGHALVGGAVLALAGGGASLYFADARARDANAAGSYGAYRNAADASRRLRLVGYGAIALGAALLVGGLLRYLLRDGKPAARAGAHGTVMLLGATF